MHCNKCGIKFSTFEVITGNSEIHQEKCPKTKETLYYSSKENREFELIFLMCLFFFGGIGVVAFLTFLFGS